MLRLAIVALCCTSSLPTFADEKRDSPEDSYRAWTFAVDASAAASLLGSYYSQGDTSKRLASAGTVVFLAGTPLLHLAHHRPWSAAGSLAMRVVLPLAGVGLAKAMVPCGALDEGACADRRHASDAIGIGVGVAVAMLIDSALLARGDEPAEPSIVPTVQASHDTIALGLAGRF